MKKYAVTLSLLLLVVSCKKNETGTSMDEIATATTEQISKEIDKSVESLDSANFKIKEWEVAKTKAEETLNSTSKMADSIQKTVDDIQLVTQSKAVDSAKKVIAEVVKPSTKVIKETKIIYKDAPTKVSKEAAGSTLTKLASLQLSVNNFEDADNNLDIILHNRNAKIASEQTKYKDNEIYSDYTITVPTEQFDYMIADIESTIGKTDHKSVEVKGTIVHDNSVSTIYLSLAPNSVVASNDNSLISAFSKGWNGVSEVFLFLLPLWPIMLIVGGIYYYSKKKKKNHEATRETTND